MKRSPKLMILTASYGEGHIQAARSLQQRLYSEGMKDVSIIDLMKEAHPLLHSITSTLYLKSTKSSKYGLDYYGWTYYMTRDTKPDGTWGKAFNYLGRKKLKEIVELERPDAIINTFPFGAAPELGREHGIPTFTIVTDYALHARWFHPDTYKYYVGAPELRLEMALKGFKPERIEVSGIPVREAFHQTASIPAVRSGITERFDKEKKLVLISAGSYGVLHHLDQMIYTLLEAGGCQLAVVCGRNEKLRQRLEATHGYHPHVHIFGFVDRIHELMAASSCIVTKAGGLTLTEALTLRLPIFIYKPFRGQEKENALFLQAKGAASIALSADDLAAQILQFLADPEIGRAMKRGMSFLPSGSAAETIVKDVIRSLESRLLQSV
ncbi:glycosyltransferase [Paenibacillus chartarius]|uniref:Glycosyltransferase n=1 Tax=Paenibacillus chartarius TaxID=747481 RepID=A0ABV6DGD5_9BACL